VTVARGRDRGRTLGAHYFHREANALLCLEVRTAGGRSCVRSVAA
jgi:urease beta subunit